MKLEISLLALGLLLILAIAAGAQQRRVGSDAVPAGTAHELGPCPIPQSREREVRGAKSWIDPFAA
jgi:hypothetical protein